MSEHIFSLAGAWEGGLSGQGRITTGNLTSTVSVPKSMRGPGAGTNPEELLLSAAASCYLITLAAILEKRNLPVRRIDLISHGEVSTEGGLKFTHLVHQPRIALAANAGSAAIEAAAKVAHIAEKACMISSALKGNVDVKVQPEVTAEIASNYISI